MLLGLKAVGGWGASAEMPSAGPANGGISAVQKIGYEKRPVWVLKNPQASHSESRRLGRTTSSAARNPSHQHPPPHPAGGVLGLRIARQIK